MNISSELKPGLCFLITKHYNDKDGIKVYNACHRAHSDSSTELKDLLVTCKLFTTDLHCHNEVQYHKHSLKVGAAVRGVSSHGWKLKVLLTSCTYSSCFNGQEVALSCINGCWRCITTVTKQNGGRIHRSDQQHGDEQGQYPMLYLNTRAFLQKFPHYFFLILSFK